MLMPRSVPPAGRIPSQLLEHDPGAPRQYAVVEPGAAWISKLTMPITQPASVGWAASVNPGASAEPASVGPESVALAASDASAVGDPSRGTAPSSGGAVLPSGA